MLYFLLPTYKTIKLENSFKVHNLLSKIITNNCRGHAVSKHKAQVIQTSTNKWLMYFFIITFCFYLDYSFFVKPKYKKINFIILFYSYSK